MIKRLLDELKREDKVVLKGKKGWSRWFALGNGNEAE